MFLENIEMMNMGPCVGKDGRVWIIARMSRDITELMPYLNAVINSATYNPEADTLCFTMEARMITLRSEKIAVAKALNATDAWQVLDWIKDAINQAYENRDTIQPNYERHPGVTALDIYELLPGLNCGECGEPTCLAFAVKMFLGEKKVEECAPLFTDEYYRLKGIVLDLVSALGYELPESYQPTMGL